MASFQEVVTEDEVFGKPVAQNPFKGIHIIDSFADEGTFLKPILVDIRHGSRVGIDAGLSSEDAHEPRASRAGQAQGDSGLQDRVPIAEQITLVIETRPVQWMGQGCHQSVGRLPWELSIRVERNDVLHFAE